MPKVKMTPNRHISNDAGRRPIRPIDREKMRPWLERQLDKEVVQGVKWVDRSRTTFEIPWRHAARHGWSIEKDACIFELWAIHTRKYIQGKDKRKDPKRWKANFRCALNSLPDVERVLGHLAKGSQAVRRYRFLTPEESKRKTAKSRSRKRSRIDSDSTEEEEEEEEAITEVKMESEDGDAVPDNSLPRIVSVTSIPNFDQLLTDNDATPQKETWSTSHMSGGRVFQLQDIPSPPSPHARSVSPHSLEGSSDSEGSHYSDEEVVELVNTWELENCHPKLWSDMTDLTDSINIGCEIECETEEVRSVIRFDHRDYWDLSTPME